MEKPSTSKVVDVILKRRSCRAYLPDPIPQEHVDLFIEVMRWAPSAGNLQPWHFYLVSNPEVKRKLVVAAYGQEFLAQAPLVIVVAAQPERSAAHYGNRGREMYVYQDTAAAIQNLLLTATDLGYGTCWVGAFIDRKVSEALDLPWDERPVAMIPVGKPAEKSEAPHRRSREQIATIIE